MGVERSKFSLALQEQLLTTSLPEDRADELAARRKISENLAFAVVKLVAHLKPEVVMEIGAHEASFSRKIKRRMPSTRVVAFEANPTVHEKFSKANNALGIEYLFKCVAAETRTYTFSVPGVDSAKLTMGSVLRDSKDEVFASYDVEGVSLDEFLGDGAGSNAMWIDVEGAVGTVLEGANSSLKNCALLFAELEAVERWEGQMLDQEVFRRLAEVGLFPILRDIQRRKWQHNVLFVRENAMSDPVVQKICFDYLHSSLEREKVPA